MIVTHYNITFTTATARSSRVVSSLIEASWSPSAAARRSALYADAVSEDGGSRDGMFPREKLKGKTRGIRCHMGISWDVSWDLNGI